MHVRAAAYCAPKQLPRFHRVFTPFDFRDSRRFDAEISLYAAPQP